MTVAVQQPAYDSGAIAGIPITITPMIAAAFLQNSAVVQCANLGANPMNCEIAFSYDGINFVLWPTTAFGGPDGSGLPAGQTALVSLPDKRPPVIRVRAQSTTGTTTAQITIYELAAARSLPARGRIQPYT